jgi:hypothetical protein
MPFAVFGRWPAFGWWFVNRDAQTVYATNIYSNTGVSESDFSDDKRLPRKVEDDEEGDLDEVVASLWLPRRRTCMASSESAG